MKNNNRKLNENMYYLLTWFSPSFPIGSYAYSHGLEYAIESKIVKNTSDLSDWISDFLHYGTCYNDGIIISNAYDAVLKNNITELEKISLIARLRNYFFTGVIVLVPIGFTLYLTIFLISVSSNLIPEEINPNNYLPFSIPGLEIALSIIFITLIGGLSLSFIGKRILQLINDLLKRIPILRTIYSAIGQMTESFTNNKKGKKTSLKGKKNSLKGKKNSLKGKKNPFKR